MKADLAIRRLSALAQDGRLKVFRLLVTVGGAGMAAGDIARELDTAANTMSAQLLILSNAGLIKARRDGRSIIYAVNFDGMRDLLVFLTEDCCARSPEIYEPLAEKAAAACCDIKPTRGVRHEASARSRRR